MSKINCSVGILTFNSEKTLERALKSVSDFAEIIICDGGSTDKTLEIAKKYNCKIIFQDAKFKNQDNSVNDFSGVRNQCLDVVKYDWFLYIDSDEAISESLGGEISKIIKTNTDVFVYFLPIQMFIGKKKIKYSYNYPGYQSRFFNKKSGAKFIKEVHERIDYDKTKIKSEKLTSPWYVFWDEDRVKNYSKYSYKYIKMEIARQEKQSLIIYVKNTLFRNFKNIASVIIKSSRNYLFYGFRDSMPIKVELGRVFYFLKLIYYTTVNQIKLRKNKKNSLHSL